MADERGAATAALAAGPLIRIARGALAVDIAPQAGGRIARIVHDGVDWLVGHGADTGAAIAWGCYPMVPWAGRIRRGRFRFRGADHALQPNLDAHAIHGTGFTSAWQLDGTSTSQVSLTLQLPRDARWPFGGSARQRIAIDEAGLHLQLSVTAGDVPMPATLGWHPWFRKPQRLDFRPQRAYPRDREGIAILPPGPPPPGPWDDCFINRAPVLLQREGRSLRLTSDCDHWVVYDAPAHATCVEPQSGPPDAPNLRADAGLEPGQSLSAWLRMEWL